MVVGGGPKVIIVSARVLYAGWQGGRLAGLGKVWAGLRRFTWTGRDASSTKKINK